jgi:hypothetical protein
VTTAIGFVFASLDKLTRLQGTIFTALARNIFTIIDGFAVNKESTFSHYLSIVSPSECVPQPSAAWRRYAPPIERENLNLLTGLSKEYPLRDEGIESETDGSLETRMTIVGGNVRLLFSQFSVEELKAKFRVATKKIEFAEIPTGYFGGR